jgi:hypothetical protein
MKIDSMLALSNSFAMWDHKVTQREVGESVCVCGSESVVVREYVKEAENLRC